MLVGEVVNGVMQLNDAGRMVKTIWDELPVFYAGVDIDGFILMPNHIHGIIVLVGAAPRGRPNPGQPQGVAPTMSVWTWVSPIQNPDHETLC